MSVPLLKTKLHIPPQRPSLVLRPRLVQRLEEGPRLRRRLTLVSAKAGSGKTTLVSEWLHRQPKPALWLSLDANDSDPRRFSRYLVAALQALDAEIGHALLGHLEAPGLPQPEDLVIGLINDVASVASPFFLVLDDYHLVENEWAHQAVGFLAENQPPEMHLVLVTRVDPPLPLARLRGRGQITEIRDPDLRFTEAEAAQFLNSIMELGLPAQEVSALEARTEGWIAGLQMAAVSMQGYRQAADRSTFIDAFSGTHRFFLDYLMEEVLSAQLPAIQDFLIETSILERMCGDLCDALRSSGPDVLADAPAGANSGALGTTLTTGAPMGRDAPLSQDILEQLERSNLFLLPLDEERRWYRYHHLFADSLQATLRQRRTAEQIRALHRRASRWHREARSLEEAMSQAMAGQDYELAASMIEQNIATMLSRSEAPALLGWIDRLPQRIVQGRPWIDVYRANTLALSGRLEPIDPLLDGVEKGMEASTPQAQELAGHIAAIRAFVANLRGDAPRAIEMARRTESLLSEEYANAWAMASYALSDTCFAADDMQGARQAARAMLRVGENAGSLLMVVPALGDLAEIAKVEGKLFQAQGLYDQAHARMTERKALDTRLRCPYEFGLADLLREWNQLEAAREHAQTGIQYGRRFGVGSIWVSSYVVLMRVLQSQGDVKGALEALRGAQETMQRFHVRMAAGIEFKTARVVQWLAVGDVDTASRWAEDCQGGSELEQLALARLCLAQERYADAHKLLDHQAVLARGGGRNGRLVEILGLQAVALRALGRTSEASAALSQALSFACPEGHVRLFLDLGDPLRELLPGQSAVASNALIHDYAQHLQKAFLQEAAQKTSQVRPAQPPELSPTQALVDPLTQRETEVLQLLAQGLTNKEIAGRLVVAPSTAKQHLKNIYGKLDVHSRTQAVARGRELALI